MIYTFYSYKGGVGRSMALANVAELLSQAGLTVLMVDWDLEAPGLERFFLTDQLEESLMKPGVIDMLLSYKQQMSKKLSIPEGEDLPFEKPSQMMVDVYPLSQDKGKLFLLTAGKRSKEHFSEYANAVLTFDWQDFYEQWEGESYLEWLRHKLKEAADVVLIDSRTGVTEMGGVCTYQLADVVVMFCSANQQSLDGTEKMLLNFTSRHIQELRGRPLDALVVPARVEDRAEIEFLNEFRRQFSRKFDKFLPKSLQGSLDSLWSLKIPHIPRYAFDEMVVVREEDESRSEDMMAAFISLEETMLKLADSRLELKLRYGESKGAHPTLSEDKPTQAPVVDTVPARVLIVDDIEDWRKTLSGLLEDEGYATEMATGATEALSLLESTAPDVAVLDVRLDESHENNRDGLTLMHEINERYPTVSIIILTGYADVHMVREALQPNEEGESAALGFIQKTEQELSKLIDYIELAIQRPVTPLVFNLSQECQITLSLKPGERLGIRVRGSIHFSDMSQGILATHLEELAWRGIKGSFEEKPLRALTKNLGEDLYRSLFKNHPSILNGYQRALGRTSSKQYLHLVFETRRDLIGLPVEFLFSRELSEYLVLLHPLARQIRGTVTRQSPITTRFIQNLIDSREKLRVLILTSEIDFISNSLDKIGAQLRDLLSGIDWIDATYIDSSHTTYDRARELLHRCKYHVVHYIGQDFFSDTRPERAGLPFWEKEDRSGNVDIMLADELEILLRDAETRLFHMTYCEKSSLSTMDFTMNDHLGLVDSIIQAGVPSVLSYRWPISALRAEEMVELFYTELVLSGSPQYALLQARRKLAMSDKDDLAWLSPMLVVQS